MYLNQLSVTNYKNYEHQSFEFSAKLNAFVGLNGVGKTNLLDAIHLLCLCRSHLAVPDRALVRRGESFFRIAGNFFQNETEPKIVAKYALGQSKIWERNGVPYERLADFIGLFPVVMIAPADVDLVQEGSEERRRFLDTTISQMNPQYLRTLIQYNNLVRQRNATLKLFADNRTFDATYLAVIDQQLPGPAQQIFEQRKAFVEALIPVFKQVYSQISGGKEEVELALLSDLHDQNLAELLTNSLEKDRLLERTTRGVHRDDIQLLINDYPVKRHASQGQLKSFLLALRLAQYEILRKEKQVAPILLLDDIFDKLDENRVRHLIGLLIQGDFGQLFLSDTHRDRMESIISSITGDYKIFEIGNAENLP